MKKLSEVVAFVGSQAKLAALLGGSIKQQHISWWINERRDEVPSDYVIAVALITGWKFTPHDLRPDIYPSPTDALPPELTKGEAA